MIIYFARHGQTTGDIEGRYGGHYDDQLTDLGRQQVAKLAGQLAGNEIEALFSSPLTRAQESAQIVCGKLGLKPTVLSKFKERNRYGVLTGMTKVDALKQFPTQVQLVKDMHNTIAGAETYKVFGYRIEDGLLDLEEMHYSRLAVITHGGPMRYILSEVLHLGDINMVDVDDCGYFAIAADNGQYKMLEKEGISLS